MTDVSPTKWVFFYTECAKTRKKRAIDQPAVKFSFLLSDCVYIGCVEKKKQKTFKHLHTNLRSLTQPANSKP